MSFLKDNRIYREIDDLLGQRRFDEVIDRVNAEYGEKTIPLKIAKKMALAYFYKNDYQNALKHFSYILSMEETTENMFNVMTAALSLKNIDTAREVFDKIIKTHSGAKSTSKGKNFLPQLCVPYIRYYYACGLADAECYDEALLQLNELKNIYIQTKITDDTFLYIRGIPSFGGFTKLAHRVFTGLKKDFAESEFVNELLSNVDSEGKKIIKAVISVSDG